MSKFFFISTRGPLPAGFKDKLDSLTNRLIPDNFQESTIFARQNGNMLFGITNPLENSVVDNSFHLGSFFGTYDKWHLPGTEHPDGTYCLVRSNEDHIEVLSDPSGSRNMWYYHDENLFCVSSSQRALIHILGDFQFNEEVIPWMLSTGTIGFRGSWDKRLTKIPPESILSLNRKSWTLALSHKPVTFSPVQKSFKKHSEELQEILIHHFSRLSIDFNEWILPISGGLDSRAIMVYMKERTPNVADLRSITWGVSAALKDKNSDAYIAKKLTDILSVSNEYVFTDSLKENVGKVIERFLHVGEGNIDHIAGYMDGFKIWKDLYNKGVKGIIRGDEGFGYRVVSSPLTVRYTSGLGLCTDYSNLKDYQEFGFQEQVLHDELQRNEGETLESWRDRNYHNYRISTMLSALTDLKLPFVEVMNPLISRELLHKVRELPDAFRTEKKTFQRVVEKNSPSLKYASSHATANPRDILRMPEIVAIMTDKFVSASANEILPEEFLSKVRQDIELSGGKKSKQSFMHKTKKSLARILPKGMKNVIRDSGSIAKVDNNILAFRTYMICRMNEILTKDAKEGTFNREMLMDLEASL